MSVHRTRETPENGLALVLRAEIGDRLKLMGPQWRALARKLMMRGVRWEGKHGAEG